MQFKDIHRDKSGSHEEDIEKVLEYIPQFFQHINVAKVKAAGKVIMFELVG
jgi:hypothetical protein